MKKITLIAVAIVLSCSLYAQTKLSTFKNCLGYWNSYTKEFDFNEYQYANITFTFYETYISANDVSHSIYRVMQDLGKSYGKNWETSSIKCLDEKNRDCVIGLTKFTNGAKSSISVMYDEKCFIYILE